jgi:hydrogenase nickel incorporation protein HypA/HybF
VTRAKCIEEAYFSFKGTCEKKGGRVTISLIEAEEYGFFMHEWALAEAVIAAAQQTADKEGVKEVREVTIKVGELQQVEEDILLFALSQLKQSELKDARFRIKKAKTKLKCRSCSNVWLFSREKLDEETAEAIHFIPEVAHTYIKCQKCGSPDFEIVEGRGVWLENIKGIR